MGLHLNAGTTAINTLGYTICSAVWGVILLVIMYIGSLVRGFSHAEAAAVVSAGTMLLCFFLVVIGMSSSCSNFVTHTQALTCCIIRRIGGYRSPQRLRQRRSPASRMDRLGSQGDYLRPGSQRIAQHRLHLHRSSTHSLVCRGHEEPGRIPQGALHLHVGRGLVVHHLRSGRVQLCWCIRYYPWIRILDRLVVEGFCCLDLAHDCAFDVT